MRLSRRRHRPSFSSPLAHATRTRGIMARYTVVPTLEGPGAEEESPVRGADSPAAARLLLRVTARRTRLGTLYTCLWTRRTLAVLVCIGVAVAYIAVTLGTATPPVQLLVLGLPAAFTLAVANGANDIANSVGTSVGCGALTLNVALGLGSAVEFVGAVSMGASVTATISEGVVNGTKFEENPAQFSLLMLSVLMGAGASTLLATVRTMTRHCTALAACRWSASTCCGMIMVVSTAETAPPPTDACAGAWFRAPWWPHRRPRPHPHANPTSSPRYTACPFRPRTASLPVWWPLGWWQRARRLSCFRRCRHANKVTSRYPT